MSMHHRSVLTNHAVHYTSLIQYSCKSTEAKWVGERGGAKRPENEGVMRGKGAKVRM